MVNFPAPNAFDNFWVTLLESRDAVVILSNFLPVYHDPY